MRICSETQAWEADDDDDDADESPLPSSHPLPSAIHPYVLNSKKNQIDNRMMNQSNQLLGALELTNSLRFGMYVVSKAESKKSQSLL